MYGAGQKSSFLGQWVALTNHESGVQRVVQAMYIKHRGEYLLAHKTISWHVKPALPRSRLPKLYSGLGNTAAATSRADGNSLPGFMLCILGFLKTLSIYSTGCDLISFALTSVWVFERFIVLPMDSMFQASWYWGKLECTWKCVIASS